MKSVNQPSAKARGIEIDDHFAVRPSVQLCQEITDCLTNAYEVTNHLTSALLSCPKGNQEKTECLIPLIAQKVSHRIT